MAQDPALPPFDGPSLTAAAAGPRGERLRHLAHSQRLATIATRFALAAAILVMLGAAGLYAFRTSYDGRVYPSVAVSDIDLSGQSFAAAQQLLDARAAKIESATASFSNGSKTWSPTLQQLGVTVDASTSLSEAVAVGREAGARDRLTSALGVAGGSHTFLLKIDLNQSMLNQWFDLADRDINQHPKDAALSVVNGKVVLDPGHDGLVIDREQARAFILGSLPSMNSFSGVLPTKVVTAAIHDGDLKDAQAKLSAALSAPVKLSFDKSNWTLKPSELGQFVVMTKDGTGAPAFTLDKSALSTWLSKKVAGDINSEPVNATVYWDGNQIVAKTESSRGVRLKPSTLAENVTASFLANHGSVAVPVTYKNPAVDSSNLGALGITTKLGVGDTNFEGSDAGRTTNIGVGIGLLNGTLIAPGALFSFNHAIGEITADKGYVDAAVVDGQAIGRDIGGGICQVSTTTFRAAYFSGIEAVERWPHRYRFPFYELDNFGPGLDASILQPDGAPFSGGDFSFYNPSKTSWMLVEAYVDAPRAYVILYGPDLGWTVKVNEPNFGNPADDVAQPPDVEVVDDTLPGGTMNSTEYGLHSTDVSYDRTVTDRQGNVVLSDNLYSHYYQRAAIWTVSSDMAGKSPAASGAVTPKD